MRILMICWYIIIWVFPLRISLLSVVSWMQCYHCRMIIVLQQQHNNIHSEMPQVGVGRVGCTLTLPLPHRDRKAGSERPLAQMYQPQVQEEKTIDVA